MTLQVPIDRVRPVRTLHVDEIQGSPLCFYTHSAHEPLIIKGVFAEDHPRWWLWERTLCLQGPLDLKQLLLDLPTERFATEDGQARAQAALALCRVWEARMQELGTAA